MMRTLQLSWITLLFSGCSDCGSSPHIYNQEDTETSTSTDTVSSSTSTSDSGSGGASNVSSVNEGGTAISSTTSAGGISASGGSGGSETTSSSSETSSTSTSSETGMGGSTGCHWGDDCGEGNYCNAIDCDAGQCESKPSNPAIISKENDPVCGCDGNAYWNTEIAAYNGVSIASSGTCADPILCSSSVLCPEGLYCDLQVGDEASCLSDPEGQCWGLPISCSLDGEKAKACTNGACELICSLIQSENPWYDDGSCAQ